MKKLLLLLCSVCILGFVLCVDVEAITLSIDARVEVLNAPLNSQWKVDCGVLTGDYSAFSKSFVMSGTEITTVRIIDIFPTGGSWFCRTSFVKPPNEQGPYSVEIPVTVTVPTLSVPIVTIVP